tara:strand:+ start:492 stop:1052 length:561 start_codon:yes stop_codon:yes gene_type:complete
MNKQDLIIYDYNSLYNIFEELSSELNFKIFHAKNQSQLNNHIKNSKNYLIISNKNVKHQNQIILDNLPIKISKLVEKINIGFMRQQFSNQSRVMVNNYIIDLNSREMINDNIKLKLTEKEVNTIIYLSKAGKPVSINELQNYVWSYNSDLETHTVETHIYRLRKKILDYFKDDELIISKKDGYEIK